MTDIRGVEHAVAMRAYPGKGHDRVFTSPGSGTFAIFDGAGNECASRLAQLVFEQCCQTDDNVPMRLKELFEVIQIGLLSAFKGQLMTTGSAIRLMTDSIGQLNLGFASAGDSPIYCFDPGEQRLKKLTQSEGTIMEDGYTDPFNFLGSPDHVLRQLGSISLPPSCIAVIMSDGITDEHHRGHVTDDTLAEILSTSSSITVAAHDILDASSVPDDASILLARNL